MELVKKKIHMDRIGSKAQAQMILEEDVNISDNKPDADTLFVSKGDIILEEIRAAENTVTVKGKMNVSVLYLTDVEGMCAGMVATLPFEEKMNMDGVKNGSSIQADWKIDDLTASLINSRKISIQALVTLFLESREESEQEMAVDIYHEEPLEYRKRELPIAQLTMQKKDIFRIKEEMELSGNLPNAFQIVWHHIAFDHMEFSPMEGKIAVQGEMRAFFLYEGEGDNDRTLWYENTVPFSGVMECAGCHEGMIHYVGYKLGQCNVEVRQDFDGEERIFCIDAVLDLDIHLYEEEKAEVLSDIYGVDKEITAVTNEVKMKSLLYTGNSKCKIADRVTMETTEQPIYQLIHSDANVQIDEETITEDGLLVEGSLMINSLYLGTDGSKSLRSTTKVLPFTHVIEIDEITPACIYKLQCSVEQLTVTMLGKEDLDVKAILLLRAIVFMMQDVNLITDIEVSALDLEKLSELPGMAICVVGKGDTLWDIGKRYYVPISLLKEVNDLATEEIKAGDKILVVKGGV